MTNVVDGRRICEKEGCENLGRWSKIIHGKLYRGRLCERHHLEKYNMKKLKSTRKRMNTKRKLKVDGKCNKCSICGWDGPCDIHRKDKHGNYNLENMMITCPNCHRLIHREMLVFKDNCWIKNSFISLA